MLSVKDLSFAFGSRPLFRSISFDLKAGDLVRLAGPNGAGKSTLMALIAGLITGASGSIHFTGDQDPRSWTAWIPPDANALNHGLSAIDNLRFWLELRGMSVKDNVIQLALKEWGLEGEYRTRQLPVGLFSTGMRRRLALARLDLCQARLWLLDEPLFGLDDNACKIFHQKLTRHIQADGAALIITHDERLLTNLQPRTISWEATR